MSKWISVKDKLPPVDEKVLVIWSGQVEMAILESEQNNWQEYPNGDFQCHEDNQSGYEVTHWMELPEPPKEK